MPRLKSVLTFGAYVSLLATPALAQQATPQSPSMAAPGASSSHNPADEAMMTGMQKMQQDMSAAPMTGDADKDFVAMMIPHHAGAIAMAQAELRYGKDPTMRKLASNIVKAQESEIREMKAWRSRHAVKPPN